ncbi:hypothetical protein PQX77_007918 [Marasmius sp. AFHP31]|nr:hypothetical protein PQX77_007918 [Marasmius sp. AFHP31]
MNTGIQNHQTSSGLQNNNNATGTQNINFANCFNTVASHPLQSLWNAIVGVGASHNAEQQYARGECLSGTREEVLRIIREWILSNGREFPICWLSGTAGVGKTAIAITIAKECEQEGRLASSFFFFRSDPKRNNPSALVLTIAHGLVAKIPSCRVSINQRISNDPTILEAQMEDQFQELVVKPYGRYIFSWSARIWRLLGSLSLARTEVPRLVIIDGLDECGDERTQQRILYMIRSAFGSSSYSPLRFLICSRPEAWLQEVFAADPLSRLLKSILLNNDFRPVADIMKYYRHQFREIISSPKYNQVQFPDPWPTEEDLETLVDKSCSQFIYAVTVSRFIVHAGNDPKDQLCLVLESTSNSQTGASPYRELDALYNTILSANPDHDKVRPILAAIVILLGSKLGIWEELELTPAFIELLLGLPAGQVALRLRGMHSVLNIRGRDDAITVHHTSFRDYLLDRTRSHHFHIDIDSQRYDIARQWLQNLTTSKILSYSPSQLHSDGTKYFFQSWRRLCVWIPKPTWDLLDDLWNVDLAFTHLRIRSKWSDAFEELVPWVRKYDGPGICENKDKKEAVGNYSKAGENTLLKANSRSSCNNSQCEAEAHNPKMAEEAEGRDLVQRLVHKFENPPGCFHLVYPPGVTLQKNIMNFLAIYATGCRYCLSQVQSAPTDVDNVRLTDCCCDLSGGSESSDSGHLAYREACRQLVKAYVSLFKELAQSGAEDDNTIGHLGFCFKNMVTSSLLEHCCLDQELLSLCRTFFGLVKGCLKMQIHSEIGEKGRKNMLGWIETFPGRFTKEGKALKAQIRALPWEQWAQNHENRRDRLYDSSNDSHDE